VIIALLALAVFASRAALDYAHVRYVAACTTNRAARAANWSVIQWTAGTIGFAVAVKVSLWFLPAEAAGLWCGTWIAMRWSPRSGTRSLPRDPGVRPH
jgi:hypothetical protein